jgi:hypothetical protein
MFYPFACLLSFVAALNIAPADPGDGAVLTWRGKQMTVAEAASQLSPEALRELELWSAWCEQRGYRAVLDDEGRALLIASSGRSDLDKLSERARKAGELLERLAPLPARDPGETFLVPEWGRGQHVPERDTATVVLVECEADFQSLLGVLESMKPQLAGQLPRHQAVPAFHSSEAATGALLSAPPDIEIGTVWRVDNEVVHRLARLLLYRRFGELPYWLELGLAWNVEQGVMGNLYSFPGREEFVSVDDHAGWRKELQRQFKSRRKQPLRIEELAGWSAPQWNGNAAALAWGMGQFLAQEPPAKLAAALEELRLDMKDNGVKVAEDGSWQVVPGYKTPAERQHAILARHFGDDYLERAGDFFRTWKR